MSAGKVWLVGIGPGYDADLLTVRATRAIERADRVYFTGTQIGPSLRALAGERFVHFEPPSPEEYVDRVVDDVEGDLQVAVLFSGDGILCSGEPGSSPSEAAWLEALAARHVPCCRVSGLTSVQLAMRRVAWSLPAAAESGLTIAAPFFDPAAGPRRMIELARTNEILALLLSAWALPAALEAVSLHRGLGTLIAVVRRVGWPDEQIIHTTIGAALNSGLAVAEPAVVLIAPGAAP